MEEIKSHLKYLNEEIKKIRDIVVDINIGRTSLLTRDELDDVRLSIDEFKGEIVRNVSGELATLKNSIADVLTKIDNAPLLRQGIKQDIVEALNSQRKKAPELRTAEDQKAGKECIEALMSKTSVIPANKRNADRMFFMYERLYSCGGLVSSVLEYLRFKSDVKVLVDFDSDDIGNLKTNVTYFNGAERDGSTVMAYADLQEKVVYLGALCASERWLLPQLAQKLSLLAIGMSFQNGGRPYVKGDFANQSLFGAILALAEARQRNGEELELPMGNAVLLESPLEKEAYLISSVPWLGAEYGSILAENKIRDQLPLLLEYYKDRVVAKLHQESEEEIGI
ncbi:uncharacterized protein LOC124172713 [Ischnura elegans]|uniref:uncharacterized protein LOC124172713 n=1 Tax=Ischnura elegans TaxID=197161 RepID=UPI001ED87815|nr:uncharacterized protein LOC124172713 [Ischnura elegans]